MLLSPPQGASTAAPCAHPTSHSRALARFLQTQRPYLEILSGPARSLQIQLDQGHVTLGRGPGVDIALDDPALSRVHAELCFTGESFELHEDLGEPMLGAAPTRRQLQAGDRFRLGNQWFEFAIHER